VAFQIIARLSAATVSLAAEHGCDIAVPATNNRAVPIDNFFIAVSFAPTIAKGDAALISDQHANFQISGLAFPSQKSPPVVAGGLD
jgi:hypothetical protein